MPLPRSKVAASLVVLSLTFILSSPGFSAAQPCVGTCLENQRNALSNLFSALEGPNWVRKPMWSAAPWTADSGTTHCNWSGVACCPGPSCDYGRRNLSPCTNTCAVVVLSLPNNNLVGRLDSAGVWEDLQSIEVLNLQGGAMTNSLWQP